MHGNKDWDGSKSSPVCRNFDRIDGEPMDFEWNVFPGFKTLQLNDEVKSLLLRLDETPENFTGRIISPCRCSTTSHGDQETMKKNASQMPISFLCMQKRFGTGQWSFLGLGSVKKWYSISADSPQGEWTIWRKGCYWDSQRVAVQFSVLPIKSKGHGKLSIHHAADLETIETVFRVIVSGNQFRKFTSSRRVRYFSRSIGATRCER